MKATYEYDLNDPTDRADHASAQIAPALKQVLWEMDREFEKCSKEPGMSRSSGEWREYLREQLDLFGIKLED